MDDIDTHKHNVALLALLESEQDQRRIKAGELVIVPLSVVIGSRSQPLALAKIEAAKAEKLAELREAGETREVKFTIELFVTGVCRPGEATGPAWKPAPRPRLPSAASALDDDEKDTYSIRTPGGDQEPQPPVIETYICVQTRQCRDDDDAGEIAEGWFSVDGRTVTVTSKAGGYVGSRAVLKGEDARVVAKLLLREKKQPSDFNRPLSYPNAGLA